MSGTTQYTVKLIDGVTGPQRAIHAATVASEAAVRRLADAMLFGSKAERRMAQEASRLASLELRAAKSIGAADRAAEKFNATASKKSGWLKNLGTGANALAGVFGSYLVGATIRVGREFLEAAGNAQILERNFARVTGDPKELEQTRALIKNIGLDLVEGEAAALKLRTTFDRFTAEALLKTFSALNLLPDELKRASLALSQIQGKGKLQAEELNQFVEAVPGVDRGKVIAQIAKEMKITSAEAAAKLGKGQIKADVGVRALIFGALESQKIAGNQRGDFGGVDKTIAAGAGDINRQLTALDNSVVEFKRAFGAALASPAVVDSINAIAGALSSVSKMDPTVLRAIGLGVAGIALALGSLGAVAGYLAVVSAGVGVLTGTLIPATAAAWAFVAPVLIAAAPFIAAGAAIAFLGYQVTQLWKELGGWDVIWPAVKGFFTDLGAAALDLGAQALDWGKNIVMGLVNGITSNVSAAVDAVTGLGSSVIDTAKDVFGIHSPSRVFGEMGQRDVEGLAFGLDDYSDLAFASAEALGDGVVSETEMALATGNGINQTAAMNVGAAAGSALGAGSSSSGGQAPIQVGPFYIDASGAKDPSAVVDAVRGYFELDFAALLDRYLEAQGA
jgi:tape measure domain-containing protein